MFRGSLSSLRILWSARITSPKKNPLWARLYQNIFCKKPSLFSSSCWYRNLSASESACRHYAHPNLFPFLLATPSVIHEKNWKGLDIQAQGGFPRGSEGLRSSTKSLWTPAANPASHAIDRCVLLRVPHFYFCFRFLLLDTAGFP